MDTRTVLAALAMAALGLTAAGAIAVGADNTGTDGRSATPRTVVATPGLDAPHAVPQAVTVTASAEVPVRLDTKPGAASLAQPQDLRQIVYTVAGNQRPDDPVTVVYADETGALRTVGNVTLPWTMTIVPNLPVAYVTANSRGSQLNCWITDASGKTVVSQTDYGTFTTCNR